MYIRDIVLSIAISATLALVMSGLVVNNSHAAAKKDSITLSVPDSFFSNAAWDNLIKRIKTHSKKQVILDWQGFGGLDTIGFNFTDKFKEVQKKQDVTISITGEAISMHALALCYVKNVKFTSNGVMIFHPAFNRDWFGNKKYAFDTMKYFNECVEKGYLTKQEVKDMYNKRLRIEVYKDKKKICKPDWNSSACVIVPR